jgi:alpha-tubulin suppressor-like RCC1 family protein
VLSDGTVQCWGSQALLTVGSNTVTSTTVPTKVTGITNAISISTSEDHVCVILSDNSIKCWGNNDAGQSSDQMGRTASAIATAVGYTCIITTTTSGQQVLCWGVNDKGQLGNGLINPSQGPTFAGTFTHATSISAGSYGTCASDQGNTYCWGNGVATPKVMAAGTTVSVGSSSACTVDYYKSIYCWGSNNVGQLGIGDTSTQTRAFKVSNITTAKHVSVGTNRACAVLTDGTVQCWGAWASQTMVSGSMANSTVPVAVPGITTATEVSVGNGTDCAVLDDGSLYCWNLLGTANVFSF